MRKVMVWLLLVFFVGCDVTPVESEREGTGELPQTLDTREGVEQPDVNAEPYLLQDTPDKIAESRREAVVEGKGELARDTRHEPVFDGGEPAPDGGIRDKGVREATGEVSVETQRDTVPESGPQSCSSSSACNARLTPSGACPGSCIPQKRGAYCRGTVSRGLCYDATLPGPSGPYNYRNGLKLVINALPAQATVGKPVTIVGLLLNATSAPVTVKLSALARKPAWTVQSTSFANPGSVTIAAGAQLQLSVTMIPDRATIFDHTDWIALLFMVDNSQAGIRLPVGFPPNSGVLCGGQSFPKKWCKWSTCKGQGDHYNNSRCCHGVFYPGADCCTDNDCSRGACYDGLCVVRTPNLNLATTPLYGRQRILVVAADLNMTPSSGSSCPKVDPTLTKTLNLDKVEAWMVDRVQARLGKPYLNVEWHTLLIADSKVFAPGSAKVDPILMLDQLETLLKQRGCTKGFGADFDRVLLITPRVLIPSTGKAVSLDRVVAISHSPHSLLAHELGHVYGGRDLYLTAGGKLQWRSALMSIADTSGGQTRGSWSDAVLWGEMGLGDTDKNGVIDIVQWPVDAVALVAGTPKVTAFIKGTHPELRIAVPIVAKEADGTLVPFHLPSLRVTLPDYALSATRLDGNEATFRGSTFNPAPIVAAGKVKVRLEVTWYYTHSNGTRKALTLDHSATISVP